MKWKLRTHTMSALFWRWLIVVSMLFGLFVVTPGDALAYWRGTRMFEIPDFGSNGQVRQVVRVTITVNHNDFTNQCQALITFDSRPKVVKYPGTMNVEVNPLVLQRNGVDVRKETGHVQGEKYVSIWTRPWYSAGGNAYYRAGANYAIRFQSGRLFRDSFWSYNDYNHCN